jgi:hypothetical protein
MEGQVRSLILVGNEKRMIEMPKDMRARYGLIQWCGTVGDKEVGGEGNSELALGIGVEGVVSTRSE